LRVAAWSSEREELTFEVFHVEWPAQIFGTLKFAGVRYVQTPTTTSWGYRLRVVDATTLAAFSSELESGDVVYELFTPDGAETSALIVARALDVVRT
jgi:hypothetical protein